MSVMEKILEKKYLSGSTLKIIACVSMFIDHVFYVLMHTYAGYISSLDYASIQRFNRLYIFGRNVGRIAFPIFCFLLVEGFFHTKNIKKYLIRLFIMALVSEHAFNLLYSGEHFCRDGQNVFFTLFISLLTIWGIDTVLRSDRFNPTASSILIALIALAGCLSAYFLKSDYSYHGVMSAVVFYFLHQSLLLACLGGAVTFTWEPWAITAVIPIFLYNGKRGLRTKYFFYLFYPLHIYIIYYFVNHVLSRYMHLPG